jgi:hypothetical protein
LAVCGIAFGIYRRAARAGFGQASDQLAVLPG